MKEQAEFVADRRAAIVSAARRAGLLEGKDSHLGARVSAQLVEAAKSRSGLDSTTDVVEYALAKVALEDDYGARLVRRKGTIPKDLDL